MKNILIWICSFSSLLLFVIIILLISEVRLGLEKWPSPMKDDYSSSFYKIADNLFWNWGFVTLYIAPAIWMMHHFLRALRKEMISREIFIQLSIYLLGWGMIFSFKIFFFNEFFTWYFD